MPTHRYTISMRWTGNLGTGTSGYQAYSRAHELAVPGRPVIPGSSDVVFRGDATRYNPEELLVGALSSCHMLWFLHLCADAGLILEAYEDAPEGTMEETPREGGQFTAAVLRPRCTFRGDPDHALVLQLHERAHALCYVARSVNFPVHVEPVTVATRDAARSA
jgi:organic hydroperoxide reductase OsmC/OhrA